MKLEYIDIHSHLNLSPLSENKEAVLAKMKEMGVGTITVGTGLETSKMAIALAEENPGVCWATIGVHPCELPPSLPLIKREEPNIANSGEHAPSSCQEEGWEEFERLASHPKVVAIGETGLDYFRDQTVETKEKQTVLFKKHIELAQKVGKPLMLHMRASKGSDDAYFDALEILSGISVKANFHFFSGSKVCMEAIIAAGFTVSVDGPITFSHDYDDMIRAVPLDKVMIETDAPFAAPVPYRGKPCEPWMVVEVAKKVAELKGLELEAVKAQLLENACTFFRIKI